MPSTLIPSTGLSFPGLGATSGIEQPWPYSANPLHVTPKIVLPSFGASGIPRPTTYTPPGAAATPVPNANYASPTGAPTALPSAPGFGGSSNAVAPITYAPTAGTVSSYSANPFATLINPKNPQINQAISSLLDQLTRKQSAGTGDFAARYAAAKPQFAQQLSGDLGTIGNITGGALEAEQAANRAAAHAATRSAADRALGDLTRILSLGQMSQTGSNGQATGLSSDILQMGLNNASGIETQAAREDAAQKIADLQFAQSQKLGVLGQGGNLVQQDVTRSLMPSQANAQFLQNLVGSLAPITAASNANTFYGIQSPQGFVGNDFGGVQGSQLQNLGLTYQAQEANQTASQKALDSLRSYLLGQQRNLLGLV